MLGPIFARAIMSLLQGRAAARFDRQTQQPDATQWQTLSRILSRNANTEVGRLYGFAEMKCPADFQARVPLVTAEEIAPLIARMAAGEQGVLTAQTPNFFCQTGGTTGQPKLSPVTPDYTKEFQGTIHTWLYHVRRQFPDILGGKAMYLVGTAEAGRTEGDIPYGTMTGYNFKALPGFMQKLYALPYEYALIQDYEAKYYTALRIALPQDVRFLISVTPNNLLLLGRKLAQYDERLLDDLEAGTLWDELPITAEVRQALAPGLGPQPEVARRLRELRQRRGSALRPVDVWPNLRLLACWKSGPSAPYLEEFPPLYADVPIFDAIYSATEGWMNIPMSHTEVGGALAVGTHFFEFFAEQDEARQGPALLAGELQEGQRYAIVLTASSGMYRYDIGDIVTCVGHYHRTPVVAFSHKQSGACNLVGEKLNDGEVSAAVTGVTAASGLKVIFFTLVPGTSDPPAYRAVVEFATTATGEQAQQFRQQLERQLRQQAWGYENHRKLGDLGPLSLSVLQAGSNDRFRAAFLKGGGNEAQMKPRHLVEDPSFLHGLKVEREVNED